MSQTTTADLAKLMKTTFDPATEAQAQMILDQIEAYIKRILGISFGEVSDYTKTLVADGHGLIELPLTPVTAVTSVKYIDGTDYRDGWGYNDDGYLYNITPGMAVRVTWSYGFATMPDDLKGVVLSMAERRAYNPQGIRQKTVGSESITFASAADAGAVNPSATEREILDSYRDTEASWRLNLDKFPNQGCDHRLPTL
jgi:hypothetical protein